MFNILASGPTVHVAPGEVFSIGGVSITNSMVYGWISIVIIIAILTAIARKLTVRPKGGLTQFIEVGVDFVVSTVESSFVDRKRAKKYIPFFVTLFFFILLNNWLGLIPLVGEGFQTHDQPVFRPFTADLNGTLAIGIVTMIVVYGASIRELGGLRKYLRHFFIGNPLNPGWLLIGILEMFSDLTRVFSLSLRLFLNVTIGEIIIAVFSYLGHTYFSPVLALPFTLLELIVGALQAYVFTLLGIVYLSVAVNSATEHENQHNETPDLTPATTPETMKVTGAV